MHQDTICRLDVEESIRKQKVIYSDDDNQSYSILFEYIISIFSFAVILIIAIDQNVFGNQTARIAALVILIPGYVAAIVLLTRKLKNKKFQIITTNRSEATIMDKAVGFAQDIDFYISFRSSNCLIAEQRNCEKRTVESCIIVINSNVVYFAVIQKENILSLIDQRESNRIKKKLILHLFPPEELA